MTEHRKFDSVEAPIPEPLSPELVLVDPQLAALARERLDVVDERAAPKRSAAEQPSGAPPTADDLGAPAAADASVRRSVRERYAAIDVTFRSQEDGRPAAVAEREVDVGAASPADVDEADEWLFPSIRRRKRRRYAAVAFAAVLIFAAGGLVKWARDVWELNGSDAGGGTPNAVEQERVGGARSQRKMSTTVNRPARSPHPPHRNPRRPSSRGSDPSGRARPRSPRESSSGLPSPGRRSTRSSSSDAVARSSRRRRQRRESSFPYAGSSGVDRSASRRQRMSGGFRRPSAQVLVPVTARSLRGVPGPPNRAESTASFVRPRRSGRQQVHAESYDATRLREGPTRSMTKLPRRTASSFSVGDERIARPRTFPASSHTATSESARARRAREALDVGR
jgi:hypothetical protein